MTLLLGEAADPVDEAQRCREVRELEGPRDPRRVVDEIPVRCLTTQGFGFLARQRRNSAAARGAGPFGKRSFHDAISLGRCSKPAAGYPLGSSPGKSRL